MSTGSEFNIVRISASAHKSNDVACIVFHRTDMPVTFSNFGEAENTIYDYLQIMDEDDRFLIYKSSTEVAIARVFCSAGKPYTVFLGSWFVAKEQRCFASNLLVSQETR